MRQFGALPRQFEALVLLDTKAHRQQCGACINVLFMVSFCAGSSFSI